MGFLSKLFGSVKSGPADEFKGKPPIYGGDGSTIKDAIVVNCAAVSTENHVIDRYISERHGVEDSDWTREIIFVLSPPPEAPDRYYRSVSIKTKSGQKYSYIFDCTRSHRVLAKMLGL